MPTISRWPGLPEKTCCCVDDLINGECVVRIKILRSVNMKTWLNLEDPSRRRLASERKMSPTDRSRLSSGVSREVDCCGRERPTDWWQQSRNERRGWPVSDRWLRASVAPPCVVCVYVCGRCVDTATTAALSNDAIVLTYLTCRKLCDYKCRLRRRQRLSGAPWRRSSSSNIQTCS